ncbi:MAG: hypothetical protein ABSE93_27510 [Terriglobia bacterium]
MPDRIANIVILVEDVEQQNLLFRFLERCDHSVTYRRCRFERAAKRSGGSGEQFVRNRYPAEVKEHRSRVGKGVSALLAVMVDADRETTQDRASQLSAALEAAGKDCPPKEQYCYRRREEKELIIVLIPKRHVETWIRALLGNQVDEVMDYTRPTPTAKDIKDAAAKLHEWTRRGANQGTTSPASLTASLPEWRKIPS